MIQHPDGFEFEFIDADPRRVKQVRVRKVEAPAPPEALAETG